MSISEMESVLGIRNEDKIECPHMGDHGCDDCKIGLNLETCIEAYEEWLMEKIAEQEEDEE